jgi:hypothetical protein
MQVMIHEDGEKWLQKTQAVLLPPIREKAFRTFPFYVPLLERKSLEHAQPGQLEAWLGGAASYIRESTEDSAILLASKEPLTPLIERLRGSLNQNEEAEWTIPSES